MGRNLTTRIGPYIQITSQLEWFNENYSKAILLLKETFGEGNVKVKFGIIQFWW